MSNTCPQCGLPKPTRRRYCCDPCYWEFRAGDAPGSARSIRREAQGRGLQWPDVQSAFEDLRDAAVTVIGHEEAIRETAWTVATGDRPRAGPRNFVARYGRRVAESDYTQIPGYDTVAQEVGWLFPEFADDDGCVRLWEFLLSPVGRKIDWRRLYLEAMDEVERQLEYNAAVEDPSYQFGPSDWE